MAKHNNQVLFDNLIGILLYYSFSLVHCFFVMEISLKKAPVGEYFIFVNVVNFVIQVLVLYTELVACNTIILVSGRYLIMVAMNS